MKLVLYTVNQKTPPTSEDLILWDMVDDEVEDFRIVRAETAIPEEGETVPAGTFPTMIWSNGSDMQYDDVWSYTVTSKGE